jgi:hypothetical protein
MSTGNWTYIASQYNEFPLAYKLAGGSTVAIPVIFVLVNFSIMVYIVWIIF